MTERATLIFDGDDTLWKTHFLYEKIKTQTVALLTNDGIKVDRDIFVKKVDSITVAYGMRHGFINTRFPTALTEAYRYFCQQQKVIPNSGTLQQVWKLGVSVAKLKPKIMPHAKAVLKTLSKSYDCILYTLGNEEEQLFRVNSVSLTPYFKNIFVVLHKNQAALAKILYKLNLSPELTWMIGNSAKSDMVPALDLGLNCIWLHSEYWLFDDANLDTSRIYEVSSLVEIYSIIDAWELERG